MVLMLYLCFVVYSTYGLKYPKPNEYSFAVFSDPSLLLAKKSAAVSKPLDLNLDIASSNWFCCGFFCLKVVVLAASFVVAVVVAVTIAVVAVLLLLPKVEDYKGGG